jgi:hypothetical protein
VRSTRRSLLAPALSLGLAAIAGGCVDAPITPDQLEPSGRLSASAHQAAFGLEASPPAPQRAVTMSAVLAAEAAGALADRHEFRAAELGAGGMIHLHVRADGLTQPRAVTYRWTHLDTGTVSLTPGVLAPADALGHAASLAVPHAGAWTVEILGAADDDGPAPVLFSRDFVVKRP